MKKHYELEYNFMEDGWKRLSGKFPTKRMVIREINRDANQFKKWFRIIQVTERVVK